MTDVPGGAYLIVAAVSALVASGELVSRYRDAPLDILRRLPSIFYLAVNGAAGMAALLAIDAFDWTFGAQNGLPAQITQVAAASISSMAVLRSSVFTIRIGGTDVHAGPYALIKALLDSADRAVDRGRAQRRSKAVDKIMSGVNFDKAMVKLPSDCFALMQNVSPEEQQAVLDEVKGLNKEGSLGNALKVRQLGLVLMNVVGEEVLRASVVALDSEIRE